MANCYAVRYLTAVAVSLWIVATATAAPRRSVIIDTDVGADDLMAISLLLSRRDVKVEAITVVNGLAHVPDGANNVVRLLHLARRDDVPVYRGRQQPLSGGREFPTAWRKSSDNPGVGFPRFKRRRMQRTAAEFLAERLSDRARSTEVLALGPLTNMAEAFRRRPEAATHLKSLVIMGGAVAVPGNANNTAEWNIYIDPEAAREVFASGAPIVLIPLDATGQVPIDKSFVDEVRRSAVTPLARLVVRVLDTLEECIDAGHCFAWDPLAAAILIEPSLASFTDAHIEVVTEGENAGRTVATEAGAKRVRVAVRADAAEFRRFFIRTLDQRQDGLPK